jgi:hypothetical protein
MLMSRFPRAAIGLAAAGLAATGVAIAPQLGSAAPARATTHTLRLAAHQTAIRSFPPVKFASADTDRNPATGKVRGFDAITSHFNFRTNVVKMDAAIALKGGVIIAHLVGATNSRTSDGIITGGSGKYKGIKGTIHMRDKGTTVTRITLSYTL